MAEHKGRKLGRRTLIKGATAATLAAASVCAASYWTGGISRVSRSIGKKVIVIGVDGMDPRLTETMMKEGQLPNLARMSSQGGFQSLGTSIPPQSPVAWAN
ncbi:MAG: sulfatase arylsulfatase, partial [Planctomyces sp.]